MLKQHCLLLQIQNVLLFELLRDFIPHRALLLSLRQVVASTEVRVPFELLVNAHYLERSKEHISKKGGKKASCVLELALSSSSPQKGPFVAPFFRLAPSANFDETVLVLTEIFSRATGRLILSSLKER